VAGNAAGPDTAAGDLPGRARDPHHHLHRRERDRQTPAAHRRIATSPPPQLPRTAEPLASHSCARRSTGSPPNRPAPATAPGSTDGISAREYPAAIARFPGCGPCRRLA
jgi:hypothetical protein